MDECIWRHQDVLSVQTGQAMFEPERLPAPDAKGFFFHPDIPWGKWGDDLRQNCRSLGYDSAFVQMDTDNPRLGNEYSDFFFGEESDAVSRWHPTPPKGYGWILVAKFDTEDGPYAMFVRARVATATHAPNRILRLVTDDGLEHT